MYKPLHRCETAANGQVFSILEFKYNGFQESALQTWLTQHNQM